MLALFPPSPPLSYLIFKPDREELLAKIDAYLAKVLGKETLTSSQSSLVCWVTDQALTSSALARSAHPRRRGALA